MAMPSNCAQPGHFPVSHKSISLDIKGNKTDIVISKYDDSFLVIVTQIGCMGTILHAKRDEGVFTDPTYNISVLFGKRDEPLLVACARQLIEHISSSGSAKPLVLSLGLKDHSQGALKDVISAIVENCLCSLVEEISEQPYDEDVLMEKHFLSGVGDRTALKIFMLELVRVIACQKPAISMTRNIHRVNEVVGDESQASKSPQDFAAMEGTQLGLETVVSAIFDGSADCATSDHKSKPHHMSLQGLLQQLLSLKWTEPSLAVVLGHYLDAFGPFWRHNPDAVASIVNKFFELLTSVPVALQDPSINYQHARLQICTSFIRISRAADKTLLPHMKGIADTMAYLQKEGRLRRGEYNLLCGEFLLMASLSGIQQQVLAWFLEPLNKMWTQGEWQNTYLSNLTCFTRLFSDSQLMWSIYNTITFFEKALQSCGAKQSATTTPIGSAVAEFPDSSVLTPKVEEWENRFELQLLRCIHALWTEPVAQNLTGALKAAKSMSFVEQANLQREGESKEIDIKNWLLGIRDSG